MKLKYKIFVTLIVTSCLILLLGMGVMQYSIRKDFAQFLNDVEFGKQTLLLKRLKESYAAHKGWNAFLGGAGAWHRLLSLSRPEGKGFGPSPTLPRRAKGELPPPRPNDPLSLDRRLCLFDADKVWVAGKCRPESRFAYHPIVLSGDVIGWLGLENRDDMRTPLELEFLKKQTRSFTVIGLGVLLLSLLISYFLSRHVLAPVQALARGTRAMREFDFEVRVDVNSTDELGALAADFNLMVRTLKQYETMRKNWISDISHELRTPVAVIRSKIEALQDGIRELTPEMIASLHNDIMGLGRLIDDLHQISLMDSKTLSVNLEPISILSIVNQALETFLIRFEQQRIDILKEWKTGDFPLIPGDASQLRRVFGNLLENVLKYTDSPGILKLSCRLKGEMIRIEMEDSPPGVPQECLQSIFERLFRVEGSRNRALGGSGLGLSMSREIIRLHQGTITAMESSLGGLKIAIELPLANREAIRNPKASD